MARRSSLLLLAVLIQLLGPTFALPGVVETTRSAIALPQAGGSPLDVVVRVGSPAQTITILRGPRPEVRLNSQVPAEATCSMRVMPADPSIDQKMLRKPDPTKDYTLQVVPPPCQASHPAQPR